MPFPWKKKNNATRFSQLVADLHHSPKRASSLVVHTGFPTSLIDLFVKNRTRFTKPNNSTKPVHVKEFPPTPPPPPPPSPVTTPIIPEPAILNKSALTKEVSVESSGRVWSIDEIEVAEIKSEVGICCEESFLIDGNGLKDSLKLDCDDDDDESSSTKVVEPCGISKCKSRGNSSCRFKSKMVKKLVPKKFRGYNNNKKEKKEKRIKEVLEAAESGSEISSAMDEEKSHSFEVDEEERESQSLLKCVRGDDKGINCSKESILAKEEEVINEKRIVIERDGNSGYTILLLIALVGLVVGRFQALILTITWCLVLKIVKTLLLLWRSHNCVPLVKFSVSNS
ncbi:hypothetical protein RIF29_41033 [Crotalaria pallida]|uniref:Uncharacterized protein n=1 Tax=Crotalaria pallida TaxID=3830 RepID=A0AAN9E781_CROPI